MANVLTELKTVEDLDRLVAAAGSSPILIYKHSLTCGTSGMALEEVRELLSGPRVEAHVGLVQVQPARAVSNEIARRFGIRHETPQILLIQDDRVSWHASHFRVTAPAIRDALVRHGRPEPAAR